MSNASRPKKFYACLDTFSVRQVPQALQHQVIRSLAAKLGGEVVFYVMEEWYTIPTLELLIRKLGQRPEVDGFLFFRLSQFYPDGKPKIGVLEHMLEMGYELHFAREGITFRSREDLEKFVPHILACSHIEKRDRTPHFFHELEKLMDAEPAPEATIKPAARCVSGGVEAPAFR